GDLHSATNHTLRHFGCPERSMEEIRSFVGNGARVQMEKSLPGRQDDPPVDQVLAFYQEYYRRVCAQGQTRPYPGISEALEQLKGKYALAIVSNKPDAAVKTLCRQYFPGIYALGVTEDCPRKPAPDMVKKTLAQLGVESCLYVGDSEVDIATAKNAGVPCLCVLWGFRDKEILAAAGGELFCEDAQELVQCIEEHYGK
ncbi:MAG: HAD-IA family hydrolase, partial [Oscillospiraceae bacterium]|nr:HAD-IA family hydrolase [Oscillospiraceae bacterium]